MKKSGRWQVTEVDDEFRGSIAFFDDFLCVSVPLWLIA
jgi:hypothetical protein